MPKSCSPSQLRTRSIPPSAICSCKLNLCADSSAILCTRRARTAEEKPPWLLHLMVGQGGAQGEISCETDRARFIGRGRTLRRTRPRCRSVSPLSNTAGSVLDPIISLAAHRHTAPDETAVVDLVMGVGRKPRSGAGARGKISTTRAWPIGPWISRGPTARSSCATSTPPKPTRNFMPGWRARLIYADPARRATSGVLLNNRRGQSGLWGYGISGDAPIVLAPHQRPRQKIETRPAAPPGPLLLADERVDGRPGDSQ